MHWLWSLYTLVWLARPSLGNARGATPPCLWHLLWTVQLVRLYNLWFYYYYYYFKCTMCNSTLGCTHPMQHWKQKNALVCSHRYIRCLIQAIIHLGSMFSLIVIIHFSLTSAILVHPSNQWSTFSTSSLLQFLRTHPFFPPDTPPYIYIYTHIPFFALWWWWWSIDSMCSSGCTQHYVISHPLWSIRSWTTTWLGAFW